MTWGPLAIRRALNIEFGKPPHPQSNIDPFVNEVDVAIVQHGLDLKFRMLR